MKSIVSLMILFIFVLVPINRTQCQEIQLTRYVNPFIGTAPGNDKFGLHGNSGDVFPGADYPRGMLQWSPDTPSNIPGGYYYPDSTIKGFSVTHFSGRGCNYLQDFAFMPVIGKINSPPSGKNKFHEASFLHDNENASPGYYSVVLENGIKVELTVTPRTGIGRFIFPQTNQATIIVNASSSARGTTENTSVTVIGNNKLQGYATAKVGCGKEFYTIYFSTEFNRDFQSFGTWNNETINDGSRTEKGEKVGAFLTFDASSNQSVEARIGISYVSIANAEENLKVENEGRSFESIKTTANSAWNKVLNKIDVEGDTTAQKTIFYTALYHTFIHPNILNDVNGEYLGMDGKVHQTEKGRTQYENIPGWDIYRSDIALTAIIAPNEASDIMQSLINYAEQGGGGLPRWQQVNRNSGGMVGDGPVIMLATCYAFGAKNFDTKAALHAMNLNADQVGTMSDGNLVRKGLGEYIKLGYVPGSASITLEYANADFALSQFAKALGDDTKYQLYLRRSANWKNLYNTSTGFIQPRNEEGIWLEGKHKGYYTEGSATQYSWMVPFDMNGLFDKMGGDTKAISRLDDYFTKLNDGPGSEHAFMGNEPCEGNPWAYTFAGATSKTQEVVRRIQNELFTDKPSGLPGNDDAGALSSWYVFSALGIYPAIPGTDILILNSPLFSRASIHLNNGLINIEGKNAGSDATYIQSLILNGKQFTKSWIRFGFISHGGEMVYTLSSTPNLNWGTKPSNVPPSFQYK